MENSIRKVVVNQLYGSPDDNAYLRASRQQAGELSHIKDALCTIAHGIDRLLMQIEPKQGNDSA